MLIFVSNITANVAPTTCCSPDFLTVNQFLYDLSEI